MLARLRAARTRRAEDARLAAAVRAAVLRPCHNTGMHDPHHVARYVCREQQGDVLAQILDAAGLTLAELPRALHEIDHPTRRCACTRVDPAEASREQSRELHRWAGVEISAELAAPGEDVPRDGDGDAVYAALTDTFEPWQRVMPRVEDIRHPQRYWAAVNRLVNEGRAETRDISARRYPPEPHHADA